MTSGRLLFLDWKVFWLGPYDGFAVVGIKHKERIRGAVGNLSKVHFLKAIEHELGSGWDQIGRPSFETTEIRKGRTIHVWHFGNERFVVGAIPGLIVMELLIERQFIDVRQNLYAPTQQRL